MSDEVYGRRGNMVCTRITTVQGEVIENQNWWFWCPGCEELHAYTVPRWTRSGTDDAPSFTPSLLVTYGKESPKRCHLYLRAGQLQFLGDCTHALKGQTVLLPEPPKWLYEEYDESESPDA